MEENQVTRSYRFIIDNNDKPIFKQLLGVTKVSKDIYNQALYQMKQSMNEDKFLSKFDLAQLLRHTTNLEGDLNYLKLPAQSSQQTVYMAHQTVTSFFAAIKAWKKDPSKFREKPGFPNFLKKDGHQVMTVTCQTAKMEENTITFRAQGWDHPLKISIPEKEFLKYKKFLMNEGENLLANQKNRFKQIRIVPKYNGDYFAIEIVYKRDVEEHDLDEDKSIAVDIGVNNLMTVTSNFDSLPFIINGRPVKSINQYFNKKKATITSELNLNGHWTSKKLRKLHRKRNAKVDDYLHKASRHLIQYCLDNKISKIFIGYNEQWKNGVEIGKVNNQNFVMIPFHALIGKIEYKAELVGITVEKIKESHTSKCSALDLEPIEHHETYLGRRINRGLFEASDGRRINADVNGSLNILRRAVGDEFMSSIENILKNPTKITMN